MNAAIFDFDGLLVDSEPLWRRVEVRELGRVGLSLTEAECEATTGLRIDEVVAHWFRRAPWGGATPAEVTTRIVDAMERELREAPIAKPGIASALDVCRRAGWRLAVASSSPTRLLQAGLEGLGLRDVFEHVMSAENERFGKPHPAVFLNTADALGVDPTECVVFEDSLNGCLAAKAARMSCVVIPERDDPRFVLADLRLASLAEWSDAHVARF
ncbi:MAG: hexitol phosphatase HxpB [Sandaracinus sp.]|nr:hexitol phosphatase HxpB [Myxococcales bacterium]MCB9599479.1 hexitol phosphatase HxpB [Sandaracinus sp.]MCB9621766.1 hexitol phosphatase HxpB [Sandaracinus sp.]